MQEAGANAALELAYTLADGKEYIRTALAAMFGETIADGVRVLYGGSVTEDNASAFFRQPEIDGALVGGASLRADSFVGIVQAARR